VMRRIWRGSLLGPGLSMLAALAATCPGDSAQSIGAVTVYIRCSAEGRPVSQGSGVLVSADGLASPATLGVAQHPAAASRSGHQGRR
jgi:hypothetical protein